MDEATPKDRSIFYAALAVTGSEERRQLLDSLCTGDPKLRQQVAELLAAHEDDSALKHLAADAADLGDNVEDTRVGQMIGRFKLREKIGEGGFGLVYMADQLEPIQRRVALKVIKAGMDTKQVIARFEAERQALSMMDHPSIATVFDAGATDTGRPYFVMELVRGIPVTEYCDQHELSTDERLAIFTDICAAIQHAHQKGIIHRDIKPTNILVTIDGDRPIPKVIDFGIAKATQGRLTDKTVVTQFRQFMGTPAYTSPEQAEMSAVDVDTRSDIYSLGVLLYELLTGKTPLDSQELLSAGIDEMRRRIREEEPCTPSTRLSRLSHEEQTTVARQRRTEPQVLGSAIRGELDWIVMRTLEKDRARRYETADSLKQDVQRYLNDEPVAAAAPSATYKLSKFVRRNKKALAALAAILTLLIVGTIVSCWQAILATRQSERASVAEQEARRNLETANQQRELAAKNESLAKRHQYAAEMLIAQRSGGGTNSENVWELLQKQIPQPNQPDFRGFEWRALWNGYRGELFSLVGHSDEIRSISISPDGNWLASGSVDGTARLWNVQTRRPVWVGQHELGPGASGKETHCNSVSFSPVGKLMLTVFGQANSALWDISNPTHPTKIRDLEVSGEFSADGQTLFGQTKGRIMQWSLDGTVLKQYIDPEYADADGGGQTHGGKIWSFALSAATSRLVSTGGDSRVKIWDTKTGAIVSILRGDTTDVLDVAFSPDGKTIATSSGYGIVAIWDDTGKELRRIQLEEMPLDRVQFSQDGKKLLISERYGSIRVLETETWEDYSLLASRGSSRRLLKCSPTDPDVAVTTGQDGVIRFWETSPTEPVLDHPSPVRSVKFTPDGEILAVGMTNGAVQFWNVTDWSKLFAIRPAREVNPYEYPSMMATPYKQGFIAFSPDAKKAAIIGPKNVVTVWDLRTKQPDATIDFPYEVGGFYSVLFAPDGQHLFTGILGDDEMNWGALGDDVGGLLLWDLADPSVPAILSFPGMKYGAGTMAHSHDSATLASAHQDVQLWSLKERTWIRKLPFSGLTEMEKGSNAISFSPDGTCLAAGSFQSGVWIWDTQRWQNRILYLRDIICTADFSPDGDRFVASDVSGMVKLWDVATWQPVATYHGSVVDFSPDGTILAVGCDDHFASRWMPQAGRVRLHYAPSLAAIDAGRAKSARSSDDFHSEY